jgi:hypothetical protein
VIESVLREKSTKRDTADEECSFHTRILGVEQRAKRYARVVSVTREW